MALFSRDPEVNKLEVRLHLATGAFVTLHVTDESHWNDVKGMVRMLRESRIVRTEVEATCTPAPKPVTESFQVGERRDQTRWGLNYGRRKDDVHARTVRVERRGILGTIHFGGRRVIDPHERRVSTKRRVQPDGRRWGSSTRRRGNHVLDTMGARLFGRRAHLLHRRDGADRRNYFDGRRSGEHHN